MSYQWRDMGRITAEDAEAEPAHERLFTEEILMDLSEWSPIKNGIVNGLMSMLMRASSSSMSKYPQSYPIYYYIDMNAADGSGSPRIFINNANKIGLPYRALFIEQDQERHADLEACFANCANAYTYCGDHADALLPYCQGLRGKPYGLIYNDNCGVPTWDALASVSQLRQVEHMDFIINCPATAIKRVRRVFKRDEFLIDSLKAINKAYWMVRYPEGRWQWTILVGTNWKDNEWRAQRMYPISSPEGQEALDILNRTKKEREEDNGQLPLSLI